MSKNTLLGAADALIRMGMLCEHDPKQAEGLVAAGLRGIANYKANDNEVIVLELLQMAVC